jgi:hypothetical protein
MVFRGGGLAPQNKLKLGLWNCERLEDVASFYENMP